MGKEVANKAVIVAFMHGQGIVSAGPEDTWGKVLGEGGNVRFFCRGEFDEAGKVGSDGVESGDVCETKLTEGILKDGYAGFGRGRRIGG